MKLGPLDLSNDRDATVAAFVFVIGVTAVMTTVGVLLVVWLVQR